MSLTEYVYVGERGREREIEHLINAKGLDVGNISEQ